MDILEGRKLNEAVVKAFGPIESSADAYLHDRPCYEDGLLKYHQSDDLTWAVVDGLLEKFYFRLAAPWEGTRQGWYAEMELLGDSLMRWHVCHPHRNTAILNACLRAMEMRDE